MKIDKFAIRILSLILILIMCTSSTIGDDKSAGQYVTEVRQHFKKEEWAKGKVLLDEAIKKYSTHTNINELMGWYYTHFHKYERARYYLVKSLKDDASTLHSRDLLITVEEETGNYSSALCYLNEQLEYKPYSIEYWRRKIYLYRKMNNVVEADRCLKRMKQIFPNDKQVQKDIRYQAEIDYYYYKKKKNAAEQIKALNDLIRMEPNNSTWYHALSNLYLQQGRLMEAEDIASQGVQTTGDEGLLRKRVGMLTDRGEFTAAVSYVKGYMREHPNSGANTLLKQLQTEVAQHSQLYDAYIMYGKVFQDTKSQESLDFLLNTSISRAYFDDALYYLRESRKRKGETKDLLYKEYLMYLRIGNRHAANNTLFKLYNIDPQDKEIRQGLADVRYTQAISAMSVEDYSEALPLLLFVKENSGDNTIIPDVNSRLYNCYFELKNYPEAIALLDKERANMKPTRYALLYSAVLKEQDNVPDALRELRNAYENADNAQDKALLSSAYEEIALPYIKTLRARGMVNAAYPILKEAVDICPNSVDLLTIATNEANVLNKRQDYEHFVALGRARYSDYPFFLVKEAGIYAFDKDYDKAVSTLRPYMDVYLGDSTMINAFSENSELLTLQLLKKKDKERALCVVDSALVYDSSSRPLLYAKGLVYEGMHMADSAYVYQKNYRPTLMDFQEYKHHLEELQFLGLANELSFEYQQFRVGESLRTNANAIASYIRRTKHDEYMFSVNYAGRDGSTSDNMTVEEQEAGGQGVQLGLQWQHSFDNRWSFLMGGAWANKYMPQWTARAAVACDFADGWNIDVHGSWRRVLTCNKRYESLPNYGDYSWQILGKDTTYINKLVGWNRNRVNLIQGGVTLTRSLNQFILSGTADAFWLDKRFFVNGVFKMRFYPVEGNRSHVFVSAGAGTAPELTIIDRAIPSSFSNLNTFASAGGYYFFNKSFAVSLSGSWYTMYKQTERTNTIYIDQLDIATSYSNLFFLNASAHIYF